MKGVESKVSFVQKNSKSIKCIIPKGVAGALKITNGDILDWEIVSDKDQIIAKVRKVRKAE